MYIMYFTISESFYLQACLEGRARFAGWLIGLTDHLQTFRNPFCQRLSTIIMIMDERGQVHTASPGRSGRIIIVQECTI